MSCLVQYIGGELAERGTFAAQDQAERRMVRTLYVVYVFHQYCSWLFPSPFCHSIKLLSPQSKSFAFLLLILLPIQLGRGGSERVIA